MAHNSSSLKESTQQQCGAEHGIGVASTSVSRGAPTPQDNVLAIPTVEELLAAPRYGLNARELVLRAAAAVGEPSPHTQDQPQHNRRSGSGPATLYRSPLLPDQPAQQRLNPTALVNSIPPASRPVVTYTPRSSIPRLQRQACCDALLGRYLVLLLDMCGLTSEGDDTKAIQALGSASALKAAACSAAHHHEAALFAAAMSRPEYSTAASKACATPALLVTHAGTSLDALQQQYGLSRDAVLAHGKPQQAQHAAVTQPQAAAGVGDKFALDSSGASIADLFGEDDEEGGGAGLGITVAGDTTAADEQHGAGKGEGGSNAPQDIAGGVGAVGAVVPSAETTAQSPHDSPQPHSECTGKDASGAGDDNGSLSPSEDSTRAAQHAPPPTSTTVRLPHQSPAMEAGPRVRSVSLTMGVESKDAGEGGPEAPGGCLKAQSGGRVKRVRLPPAQPASTRPLSADALVPKTKRSRGEAQATPQLAAGMKQASQVTVNQAACSEGGGSTASSNAAVAEQVAEFVRGVLDPLYRAQLLDKQQYKDVVRKAVSKVMEHHRTATSAAFLLREHEAVRRLVMKLVETCAAPAAASRDQYS